MFSVGLIDTSMSMVGLYFLSHVNYSAIVNFQMDNEPYAVVLKMGALWFTLYIDSDL